MTSADMQTSVKLGKSIEEAKRLQALVTGGEEKKVSVEQVVATLQTIAQQPILSPEDKSNRQAYINQAISQMTKEKEEADARIEARRKAWVAKGNELKAQVNRYNQHAQALDVAIAEINKQLAGEDVVLLQKEFGALINPHEHKGWNKRQFRLKLADAGGIEVVLS